MIITQEPLGWSKHRLTEDYNEGLKHWIRISLYCISVTRNNNVVNELKKISYNIKPTVLSKSIIF